VTDGTAHSEVRITVATAGGLHGLSLLQELRLVKAALLYADSVTLASLGAATLEAARAALRGSDTQRARAMMSVATVLMAPADAALMDMVLHNRKIRRAIPGYRQVEAQMQRHVQEIEADVEAMRADAGADELDHAVKAGLLEIEPLDVDPLTFVKESVLLAKWNEDGRLGPKPAQTSSEPVIRSLIEIIGRTVSPTSDTYPLFDEDAAAIVSDKITSTASSFPVSTEAAAEVGLASSFVGRLPAFPDATMKEVVDVRRAARSSLATFRAAVAGMASEVRNAQWDPGFDHEARALFVQKVEPALQQVQEDLHDLGAVPIATHVLGSAAPYVAAATTIGLALTAAPLLPDLAAAGLSVGTPLVTAAAAVAEGVKEVYRRKNLARLNQFVWLYEVGSKLDERTSARLGA
jgi:hypothetical protein